MKSNKVQSSHTRNDNYAGRQTRTTTLNGYISHNHPYPSISMNEEMLQFLVYALFQLASITMLCRLPMDLWLIHHLTSSTCTDEWRLTASTCTCTFYPLMQYSLQKSTGGTSQLHSKQSSKGLSLENFLTTDGCFKCNTIALQH